MSFLGFSSAVATTVASPGLGSERAGAGANLKGEASISATIGETVRGREEAVVAFSFAALAGGVARIGDGAFAAATVGLGFGVTGAVALVEAGLTCSGESAATAKPATKNVAVARAMGARRT